ncbi:MAG: hypothetical protein J5795_08630 [Lachnospiraceae bacterium]|nr:hypothetical protein [Lachnospiraceae bacterium]
MRCLTYRISKRYTAHFSTVSSRKFPVTRYGTSASARSGSRRIT